MVVPVFIALLFRLESLVRLNMLSWLVTAPGSEFRRIYQARHDLLSRRRP